MYKYVLTWIILFSYNADGSESNNQTLKGIDCEDGEGPLQLCLLHQTSSHFEIGWKLPGNKMPASYPISVSEVGSEKTQNFLVTNGKKKSYIVSIFGITLKKPFTILVKAIDSINKTVFESQITVTDKGLNEQSDGQSDWIQNLKFVDYLNGGLGVVTWKVAVDLYTKIMTYYDSYYQYLKSNLFQLSENKRSNVLSEEKKYGIKNHNIWNLKDLRPNTSYFFETEWQIGDQMLFLGFLNFKTTEFYEYPMKPKNFQVLPQRKNYSGSYLQELFGWELPMSEQSFPDFGLSINDIRYKLTAKNLKTGKIREKTKNNGNRQQKLMRLLPCEQYEVTLKAVFTKNDSYSETKINITTQTLEPDYVQVEGTTTNTSLTIYLKPNKDSCPPDYYIVNITGVSHWDNLKEATAPLNLTVKEYTFTNLHPNTEYKVSCIPYNEKGIYDYWYIWDREFTTKNGVPTAVQNVSLLRHEDKKSLIITWTPSLKTPGAIKWFWIQVLKNDGTDSVLETFKVTKDVNRYQILNPNILKFSNLKIAIWPENHAFNGTKKYAAE